MANVYYFANVGTNGAAWSGRFEVASLDDKVGSTLPSNIIVNSPAFSFTPSVFEPYPPVLYGEYVTWRTYTGDSQYPSVGDGYSFDIWSTDFSNNIIVYDFSWNEMITFVGVFGQGIYDLRTDKYTVLYNYNAPGTIVQGTGGSFQLSTTPVP
jgi:hypothetical protein